MSTEHAFRTSTLSKLVAEHAGGIRIPMIQRDYAQGRKSWTNPRARFLGALKQALNDEKPLHLDFVYGITQTEDGIKAFCPLDGQQRLTTLFLLHWYLAVRGGRFNEFQKLFRTATGDSRFLYQVRPGGSTFFRFLVNHAPGTDPERHLKPSLWIGEQPLFRTAWKQDPTVDGALNMLDAIAGEFSNAAGLYQRLANGDWITFAVLDLEEVGLHDDLYLRMNARGRPLSSFETFKARYEKHLETAFPDSDRLVRCGVACLSDFSQKIDNAWLDFIWYRYRPLFPGEQDTRAIDVAFMKLFRAVALVSLPPKARGVEAEAVTLLQAEPDFDDFELQGWLSDAFTIRLIHVLETCCRAPERGQLFLQKQWFEKGTLLDRIIGNAVKPTLTDYLHFAACARFVTLHGPELTETKLCHFGEWMRVVRNLVLNSDVRADTFRSMQAGLDRLVEHSGNILGFLASNDKIPGFDSRQVREEHLKASLILADPEWRSRLEAAENHGYFRGQIRFLLDFAEVEPQAEDQSVAQQAFDAFWQRAQAMFGPNGLQPRPEFLWERALLAVGDYFLAHGNTTWSFLENDRSSKTSWKQLLQDPEDERYWHLKTLWQQMASKELAEIAGTSCPEPWRQALCNTPAAWEYCGKRLMRFEERAGKLERVFLLSAQRRRAAYAELFSFCLMKRQDLDNAAQGTRFSPLVFKALKDETGSHADPYLCFEVTLRSAHVVGRLYCNDSDHEGFSLWLEAQDLNAELRTSLAGLGFEAHAVGTQDFLIHRQDPVDCLKGEAFLRSMADKLGALA